jgi:hypothetical protein
MLMAVCYLIALLWPDVARKDRPIQLPHLEARVTSCVQSSLRYHPCMRLPLVDGATCHFGNHVAANLTAFCSHGVKFNIFA